MNNKKISIIFLDFDDIKNPLLAAGQAKATLEVGKRFAKKGHKVLVICSRYPGFKDRTENGIEYKHIGLGSSSIRLNNLVYILALPFILGKIRADIIIECFTAPVSTMLTPLWTKIPVVAVPTSFEADRFAKLYKLPFDLIEKYGLRIYKYALPYTEFFEKRFKKGNPSIITKIVPEGVGQEFFGIKKTKSEFILFLGRYDMGQKGIDLLLEAYAKVADKIQYPLVIAGKGPDEEKVRDLINKLNLQNKVTLMGPAYGKKKFDLLKKAVFVAFSSRHEGFSLFALEAIASGSTLVSFDIPSLAWISDKVVYKAKPFDVNSYASQMLLASQKNNGVIRGIEARKIARKYTWENVANEYESFFKGLIKGQKYAY